MNGNNKIDKTKRDISILKKIAKYGEEIAETHKKFGDTIENFKADRDYFKSITMSLLQTGELANHLSNEFRQRYSDIPFHAIISLRNIVAHGYDSLEYEKVWIISHENIPALHARCLEILAEI